MKIGTVVIFLILGFTLFAPAVFIATSDRSHGGAKFAWIVLALMFSWLTWLIWLIVTQPASDRMARPSPSQVKVPRRSTIRCRHCGEIVSESAPVCMHCKGSLT